MRWSSLFVLTGVICTLATVATAANVTYPLTFDGSLTGSTATGTGLLTLDTDLNTLRVEATFSGLGGTVSAAHIHCCTAQPLVGNVGVASPTPSFPDFPTGVSAGSYDKTFDLTDAASYNGAFVTANGGTPASAQSALVKGFNEGRSYLNIHTSTFGSGEIRAWIVPEPACGTLLLLGVAAASRLRRNRS